MSFHSRQTRAQALANTYVTLGDRSGWDRCQEYQHVIEYCGDHPNAGSQAVATALEIPRGRLRPWLNGAKPDPIHALDTAETNDWLDTQPGDRTFEALAVLTAWLFAGGSLDTQTFVPLFAVDDDDPQEVAEVALRAVGVDVQSQRAESAKRATELRPTQSASHLGRFLSAIMEAPIGVKNEQAPVSLPSWLETVGASTRLRWTRTYATVRGTADSTKQGYNYRLQETRSQSYLSSLGAVFQSLAPPETVNVSSNQIQFRPPATRELAVAPTFPSNS